MVYRVAGASEGDDNVNSQLQQVESLTRKIAERNKQARSL